MNKNYEDLKIPTVEHDTKLNDADFDEITDDLARFIDYMLDYYGTRKDRRDWLKKTIHWGINISSYATKMNKKGFPTNFESRLRQMMDKFHFSLENEDELNVTEIDNVEVNEFIDDLAGYIDSMLEWYGNREDIQKWISWTIVWVFDIKNISKRMGIPKNFDVSLRFIEEAFLLKMMELDEKVLMKKRNRQKLKWI